MIDYDEQRVALGFALKNIIAERSEARRASDRDETSFLRSFLRYLDDKHDREGTAISEGYIEQHGLPKLACELHLELTSARLDVELVISDAARWCIPKVGASQEPFHHAGYRGTVAGLLQKVAGDVEAIRGGYPAPQQPLFEKFLDQVQAILTPQGKKQSTGIKMTIRDPSGLSGVAAGPGAEWVRRTTFQRSFRELRGLVPIEAIFTPIDPAQQMRTSAEVADLFSRGARRVVVFTGAGASVESGVTPFRCYGEAHGGEEGSLWGTFDAERMTNANFNDDPEITKAWWAMKHSLYREFECAEPNPCHDFFAKLERDGRLAGVVTQNIDSLHTKAGVPPEKVLEIHGHMRGLICSDKITDLNPQPFHSGSCTFELSEEEAKAHRYFANEDIPRCPRCRCPLRTQTVMFGQPVPRGALARATELVSDADLLVVIGSTLIVEPANELPGAALMQGVPLVIINFDETRYDSFATALVRQPAGAFLADVAEKLGL